MPAQKDAQETLHSFISENQQAQYTFDSERGSSYSELCREGGEKGRQCISHHIAQLKMSSTELFEAMQGFGFFCALPSDPSRTHMVCNKVPQT
ncbi:hypothetical protein HYDPIDRAFT_116947 [Hydnomerulius pinastri MD-312]|uniref:Uncharacterized protein n=1 Tax=Hydnomerulius pinastri MD-312 TaxID=994086 RepID=A0A0C9W3C3_9AGAM|nr:hypothetical protein HYDPIDRAFT_116947 [Hydnomerulius pinastri MD-312]